MTTFFAARHGDFKLDASRQGSELHLILSGQLTSHDRAGISEVDLIYTLIDLVEGNRYALVVFNTSGLNHVDGGGLQAIKVLTGLGRRYAFLEFPGPSSIVKSLIASIAGPNKIPWNNARAAAPPPPTPTPQTPNPPPAELDDELRN